MPLIAWSKCAFVIAQYIILYRYHFTFGRNLVSLDNINLLDIIVFFLLNLVKSMRTMHRWRIAPSATQTMFIVTFMLCPFILSNHLCPCVSQIMQVSHMRSCLALRFSFDANLPISAKILVGQLFGSCILTMNNYRSKVYSIRNNKTERWIYQGILINAQSGAFRLNSTANVQRLLARVIDPRINKRTLRRTICLIGDGKWEIAFGRYARPI